jgi:hypothetical protein
LFTHALVTSVLAPAIQGQPVLIAEALRWLALPAVACPAVFNAVIACLQIALGLALVTGYRAQTALLASATWSLVVWVGGEGLGMLLTGQASALTGAPGAVLLYVVIALALVPRAALPRRISTTIRRLLDQMRRPDMAVIPRERLRSLLACLWALAAVLQAQPVWWARGQIAGVIAGGESPGRLAAALLNPALGRLARLAAQQEIPLNFAIIVVCLTLAVGIAMARARALLCSFLAVSTVCSLLLWFATQAFGGLLTGMATDLNSGPLLVLISLACWPATTNQGRAKPMVQAALARLTAA